MFAHTKKRTIIIVAAIAAILAVAIPVVAYAVPVSDSNIASSRTLVAKGFARQIVNGENVTVPANFTLTLQHSGNNTVVPRMEVLGGNVVVNGTTFTITTGKGGVLRGRHLILLQAQGTGPNGEAVTLRLAGRYFWMGGHLYVARIGARLITPSGNFTMLLRAEIRV